MEPKVNELYIIPFMHNVAKRKALKGPIWSFTTVLDTS